MDGCETQCAAQDTFPHEDTPLLWEILACLPTTVCDPAELFLNDREDMQNVFHHYQYSHQCWHEVMKEVLRILLCANEDRINKRRIKKPGTR
jgi:hypothetical protein